MSGTKTHTANKTIKEVTRSDLPQRFWLSHIVTCRCTTFVTSQSLSSETPLLMEIRYKNKHNRYLQEQKKTP